MSYALDLSHSGATRPDAAGSKGANLARLAQAGRFRVPGGFVVTTEAFEAHTDDPALREQIAALEEIDASDAEALEEAAAALREAVAVRTLPEGVQHAVREALDTSTSYAVRSSATAEDRPSASFAGQHETFLNVRGADDVLEKIKACMASLFTDRAVAYRARGGIPSADAAMAVVVQKMSAADAAGVLFTADPDTGSHRVAALDAVRGLGEALVSGEANADHARIDRRTGQILSYETAEEGGARVLTDAQVRALTRLGRRSKRSSRACRRTSSGHSRTARGSSCRRAPSPRSRRRRSRALPTGGCTCT